MSGKNLALVIFALVFLGSAAAIQEITCKDGSLFGIKELVESVETTVDECTNSTDSKSELFKCVFKRLDMFNDEKPVVDKIKGFFEKIYTSKFMTEAKDLTQRLMTCAEAYAQSFSVANADLGKSGEAFADCFFDATKRFTRRVQEKCKPMEMKAANATN